MAIKRLSPLVPMLDRLHQINLSRKSLEDIFLQLTKQGGRKMKTLLAQLAFDGKRLVVHNSSFIFLLTLNALGFYLLYTKMMISG